MARPVSFLGQGKEIKDAPNKICILCATVVFNAPSIDPPIKKYANEEVCMVKGCVVAAADSVCQASITCVCCMT
jgi:hypothetical protein